MKQKDRYISEPLYFTVNPVQFAKVKLYIIILYADLILFLLFLFLCSLKNSTDFALLHKLRDKLLYLSEKNMFTLFISTKFDAYFNYLIPFIFLFSLS